MKQPKISLIVIYNNSENLENCLESLVKQSFSDIEIICVNNASNDNAEEIAKNFAIEDTRIKLISLPVVNENVFAKQVALGVAGGEFVCFINSSKVVEIDFVKDLYLALTNEKMIDIQENHLYRRTFLENDEEISQLIQDKVVSELEKSSSVIKEQKNTIKNEFDKFYQQNVETIKNNSYEITCRFNQLEKVFYEKDYENQQKVNNTINELYSRNDSTVKQIYDDISKIYDYINSEINKKGCEINNVYDEISKNYQYTEQLVSNRNNEFIDIANNGKDELWKRLSELEKEIIVRYVNMKRLLDMQTDEIDSKLKASQSGNVAEYNLVDMEKNLSENLDKMYQHINSASSMFYEELSKIYREMNEKLIRKSEEDKYLMEQKVSELKNEFDAKLEALRKEIAR